MQLAIYDKSNYSSLDEAKACGGIYTVAVLHDKSMLPPSILAIEQTLTCIGHEQGVAYLLIDNGQMVDVNLSEIRSK